MESITCTVSPRETHEPGSTLHNTDSSGDVLLHPLLPPRKGHSAFSLLGNAEMPEMCTELQLFLGVQPVDRFPNRPEHFLYRLAMARLRLVWFRYAEIQQVCPHSENTLRKWARVLQSGSAAEISRTFGLASRSKVTPDTEAYVRYRYKVLLGEGRPDYRQTIRWEIENAFGTPGDAPASVSDGNRRPPAARLLSQPLYPIWMTCSRPVNARANRMQAAIASLVPVLFSRSCAAPPGTPAVTVRRP